MAEQSNGPVQVRTSPLVVTSSGVQGLSGAQNATLVLGAGLLAVSLWRDTLGPFLRSAWSGEPLAITVPAQGVLAESVFVGVLVAIGSLSEAFAQLAFWFILALWLLLIVRNPQLVTTAAGWLTLNTQAAAQPTSTQGAGAPSQSGRAPHTTSF